MLIFHAHILLPFAFLTHGGFAHPPQPGMPVSVFIFAFVAGGVACQLNLPS